MVKIKLEAKFDEDDINIGYNNVTHVYTGHSGDTLDVMHKYYISFLEALGYHTDEVKKRLLDD